MNCRISVFLSFLWAFAFAGAIQAKPILYTDRSAFLAAVGTSITDGYTDPGYAQSANEQGVLTDAQMSAVLGETTYRAITFPNLNLAGDVYAYGDGSNYCAGCNGNFQLGFEGTSLTVGHGIFGVGLDIVLHTSRHSSIGDVIPGEESLPGTILIEFGNRKVETYTVPPDVGFFVPEVFFFGLTDSRRISSLTIGTEPTPLRHFWVIDNLTIAARPRGKTSEEFSSLEVDEAWVADINANAIPEPSTYALLLTGLGLLRFARRRKVR